jgi:hypothetical protein
MKRYAVIFHPNVPQEILELFGEYLFRTEPPLAPINYFVSLTHDALGYFHEFEVIKKKDETPWIVQIPASFILAVYVTGKGFRPGFHALE